MKSQANPPVTRETSLDLYFFFAFLELFILCWCLVCVCDWFHRLMFHTHTRGTCCFCFSPRCSPSSGEIGNNNTDACPITCSLMPTPFQRESKNNGQVYKNKKDMKNSISSALVFFFWFGEIEEKSGGTLRWGVPKTIRVKRPNK